MSEVLVSMQSTKASWLCKSGFNLLCICYHLMFVYPLFGYELHYNKGTGQLNMYTYKKNTHTLKQVKTNKHSATPVYETFSVNTYPSDRR